MKEETNFEKLRAGYEEVQMVESSIENAYPEAYKYARKFHELYEYYAPQFGYETRKDTKEFDPTSQNGRLMAKVCYEVVEKEKEESYRLGRQQLQSEVIKAIEEEYPDYEFSEEITNILFLIPRVAALTSKDNK